MSDEFDEREAFFNRRTDKTVISKRIEKPPPLRDLRIATHVFDGQPGLTHAKVNGQVVLRRTQGGRYQIKATFFEDDRTIDVLTIQRFSGKDEPYSEPRFSLVGREIDTLLEFVAGLRTIEFAGPGKVHVTDNAVRNVVLSDAQARQVFAANRDLFVRLTQRESLAHDLVAIGYRRTQLERFQALLTDPAFFTSEQERLGCRPEDVWQRFFEVNTWIFGYGLSYHFLSGLDDRKLEQVVKGQDLTAAGKRADAVMRTRGLISSLCFVEVKRHDTPLLRASDYRSGAWPPSTELAGGVAQVQATVHAAVETIGRKLTPTQHDGAPTGESLFNVEPKSFLVVGSLGQFHTAHGINEPQFRSFEMYRRHTLRPEIITFDELLARARFIVAHPADEGSLTFGEST